jgi:hypothetical protein
MVFVLNRGKAMQDKTKPKAKAVGCHLAVIVAIVVQYSVGHMRM